MTLWLSWHFKMLKLRCNERTCFFLMVFYKVSNSTYTSLMNHLAKDILEHVHCISSVIVIAQRLLENTLWLKLCYVTRGVTSHQPLFCKDFVYYFGGFQPCWQRPYIFGFYYLQLLIADVINFVEAFYIRVANNIRSKSTR